MPPPEHLAGCQEGPGEAVCVERGSWQTPLIPMSESVLCFREEARESVTEGPMLSYVEQVNLLPAFPSRSGQVSSRFPVTTVRAWIRGQVYWTREGERLFRRVVIPADEETSYLSFTNLIELMVLDDLRKRFSIPLGKVRTAIESARKTFRTDHPLARPFTPIRQYGCLR